ncbi:MAG: hypothetical protein DI622_07725 [Chryseobacterium sp.]|uniref:hypothetical protein n=1 Tax=Chryseobacterium sp. TaxID=1871047 RepID=UPI000DB68F6D|nr:hypothetical protein [Chryseobacterium sp.]MPS64647.1 hypothetical protein [Chryseobacterium sp.]PZU20607.1 MAG: hypothetical protein DI622_07725 [Chryseobacterium sp.]
MRKIILLTFIFISYILQAQCTGCTVTNPTDPNYHFPDNTTVCFSSNMTFNNPTFGSNVKVCIASGVTVTFQNNISGVNNAMTYFDVHGTLLFSQAITAVADLNVHVFSTGNVSMSSGNGNFTMNGVQNIIINEGTIEMGVLQFGDNTTNTVDNYGTLTINGNMNMSNSAVTHFRNEVGGIISLTGNYSNNENSVYINCGTINSNSGFNINGGSIFNTGTFTSGGDINMSGNSSMIYNFGLFSSSGSMNNAPSDAVIYNEGKMVINQYQGGNATIQGPSSSAKKGYIEVFNPIQVNNAALGPNLDFKRSSGVSDPSTVFMNSNPTYLANVTFDCASTNNCSAPLVLNPGFCPAINGDLPPMAVDDSYTINAGSTSTGIVLDNDFETYNGPQATIINVIISQISTSNPNVTLNTTDGHITVAPGTPSGTYTLVYQICQQADPANCDTAFDTVIVPGGGITSCYKPAVNSGTVLPSNLGITGLGRANSGDTNWPGARKGAWMVLESKTKGFVLNRLTDAQIAAIPAADLKEGMIVYNTTQNCLQVNIDGTSTGWRCFNNQTCPD